MLKFISPLCRKQKKALLAVAAKPSPAAGNVEGKADVPVKTTVIKPQKAAPKV